MTERKPQSHLLNILKTTSEHHPNFVVLLGAGASKSSGVKLAGELVTEWRNNHYKMYKNGEESKDEYLKRHYWFNSPEEYSLLFESLYDQPSQRREFIESCLTESSPSWGYIYLINLIRQKVFNTIFTTNFDDLLNEACYQFSSEVRPIVCSHDSSISSIRITSNRPKIIKLHGDFLFDNIKNTVRELESLEQNTQDKFKQYASEFGFIVIGYSGNDRSIMDTFNTLLRFDQYFPHGIYWCIRKGAEISKSVELLSRFPKFKIIEIEGFDEFFAELNNELSLPLQQEMTNPYASLAMRLNRLIDKLNLPEETEPHPIIENDIRRLGSQIKKLSNQSNSSDVVNVLGTNENLPIPYGLLSNLSSRDSDFDNAFKFRMKEIETDPSPKAFSEAFKLMYLANRVDDCKDKLLETYFNKSELIAKNPMSTFDASLVFITQKDYKTADEILNFGKHLSEIYGGEFNFSYYFLNKMQILKHKGESFNQAQLSKLNTLVESSDFGTRIGAYSLLDNVEEVEAILKSVHSNEGIYGMLSWPILDFVKDKIVDEELRKLLTNPLSRRPGVRAS